MSTEKEILFRNLYESYGSRIQAFLLKLNGDPELAQDLTQETFINILKSLDTFDPDKGSFYTWATTIARNASFRHHKKNKRLPINPADQELIDSIPSPAPDHVQLLIRRLNREGLRDAIFSLPSPEKEILDYKYLRGSSLSETATALKISVSTVSRRTITAMALLRELLIERNILPENW